MTVQKGIRSTGPSQRVSNERKGMSKTWELIGSDSQPYASTQPGTLGGHRRSRIFGCLNCPAALRAIARGGYVTHRVFFLTEEHARAAEYRPCAVCLPIAYAIWKALQDDAPESRASSFGNGKSDEECIYHRQKALVLSEDRQDER
jgi:hypothetical protein